MKSNLKNMKTDFVSPLKAMKPQIVSPAMSTKMTVPVKKNVLRKPVPPVKKAKKMV